MQKDNAFFEEFAKLAGGAAGGILGLKREIEAMVSGQLEKLLVKMHLVTREEFEVVQAMAVKAREENENLRNRLAEIEEKLK